MVYSRICIVTGANKGIGFAIVRQTALQYPGSQFNDGPLLIYLTARDNERGEEALKSIQDDQQLRQAKALVSVGGLSEIKYHQLDISETKSIQDFASFLRKEHPGGIDFVINNAGVALQKQGVRVDSDVAKKILECNYYGTLEATVEFLPLIRDGGRLVNVSSSSGMLIRLSPTLQERFKSAKAVSEITDLMEDYTAAVLVGNEKEQGWSDRAYATSKTGVTTMTRIFAEERKAKGSRTLINACCPGLVETDMIRAGGPNQPGAKTPDEGAQTPVKLSLGDIGELTGRFWRDGEVVGF